MSQYDFGTINPATTSGTALATLIGAVRDAVNSAHSGSSRPAYAVAGTIWLDTTSTPYYLKMYDGTDDITICSINATGNVVGTRHAKGANVASATALPLLADGNTFDVTGTTTITSFNALGIGTIVFLHFTGTPLLTYHATDLILPGAANIQTVAGDEAIFVEYAAGDWRCISYQRAARGPNPGWELIQATAISGSAYAATGLSAFRRLRLSGWARPSTDAVNALIRTDANGGASYDGGATDYVMQRLSAASTTVAATTANSTGIFLNGSVTIGNAGSTSQESIWFDVDIYEWNQARPAFFRFNSNTIDPGTLPELFSGQGYRNDANARDAIQFSFSSGNISAGHVVLEGIRG